MENLNAEQVIKALECCVKSECNKCPLRDGRCANGEMGRLSLTIIKSQEQRIKELTEKVAKWEEECDLRGDMWCKLNEENKRLSEENERLIVTLKMNDAPFPEGLQIVHDFCEKGKRKAEADIVRKMQEMLKAQKFTHKNFGELVYVEDIDQIAKELTLAKEERDAENEKEKAF